MVAMSIPRPRVCADGASAHRNVRARASAARRVQRRPFLPVLASLMTFPVSARPDRARGVLNYGYLEDRHPSARTARARLCPAGAVCGGPLIELLRHCLPLGPL